MAEKLSKIDHWTILLFKWSKKLKMNFLKDTETNNGKVNQFLKLKIRLAIIVRYNINLEKHILNIFKMRIPSKYPESMITFILT